jgi:hypothetical protein
VLGKFVANKDVKERLAASLDKINQRTVTKRMFDAVPRATMDEAREEIHRLSELTGLELEDWLTRMDEWHLV